MTSVPAPRIVGVVNVTRDSFSDGGLYLDPGKAAEHALRLHEDGADVVELGPASSHPDSERLGPAEEILRLEPVLERLEGRHLELAIDSFEPDTQRWALDRGVAWVNDIRGFPDPSLYPRLAAGRARLVVMHSVQRGPATRVRTDPDQVLESIARFFDDRLAALTRAGVARDRLVLDPGMGFFLSDDPEPSLRVLRALPELRARWDLPLLVSVSRKSFLGALTGRPPLERGPATLAAELHAAAHGADYIRTHDVAALRDALAVAAALAPVADLPGRG